jgi:hypothetical protein
VPEGELGEPRPPRDPEQGRLIRRWLRIADEFVRRPDGKKGGERSGRSRPRPDELGERDERAGPPA